MIILDPTWSIKHLKDHQGGHRHSIFVCVGDQLQHYIDEQREPLHPLTDTLLPVKAGLLNIVDILGGPELKDEVDQFLEEFEEQLKIPSRARDD